MDKKKICAALGLPEDAADEAVYTKLGELAQAPVKLSESTTKVGELQSKLTALSEENTGLLKERDELKKEKRSAEVKAFTDKLVAEHKLDPAVREGFEAIALKDGLDAIKFLEKATPRRVSKEQGTSGGTESQNVEEKRSAAQQKLEDRITTMRSKDGKLTYRDAHALALSEMPDLREAIYGAAN